MMAMPYPEPSGMTPDNEQQQRRQDGGNAPWRWLLVIVPLLVLLVTATNLLSRWSLRLQEIAPEVAQDTAEELPQPLADRPDRRQQASPPNDSRPLRPQQPAPDVAADGSTAVFDPTAVVDRIAGADAASGAQQFYACRICHTVADGAPHLIGPNLWNIVNRRKASEPGFRYSQPLRDRGGTWTYAELAAYLHDPRAFVPGTSMAFRGISDEDRLANILAYLRTLSSAGAPLP